MTEWTCGLCGATNAGDGFCGCERGVILISTRLAALRLPAESREGACLCSSGTRRLLRVALPNIGLAVRLNDELDRCSN